MLDWRAEPQDLRCNLSVANYQYNPGKVLWASSKSDTPEVAEANDADPTKRQKEKQELYACQMGYGEVCTTEQQADQQ